MNEKKRLLKVIDRIETELQKPVEEDVKIQRTNHTNPIYKKLAMFRNTKIGDKFSIKDLFR